MCKLSFVTILLCFFGELSALKILGIFPHLGKSHFDVFEPLLKTLARKGHELTVISHFPQKVPIPGYKDISLRGESVYFDFINVQTLDYSRLRFIDGALQVHFFAQEACAFLQTEKMKNFASSNESFDIAIVELFNSDCFLGFIHKFKIPFIGLSSCTTMPWTSMRFANAANPAYVPILFSQFSDNMSFLERVENTVGYVFSIVYYNFVMVPEAEKEARKVFGDLPPLDDIAENASLLLMNTHISLNRPKPLASNVIEVGGMFLKEHEPLPKVRNNFSLILN